MYPVPNASYFGLMHWYTFPSMCVGACELAIQARQKSASTPIHGSVKRVHLCLSVSSITFSVVIAWSPQATRLSVRIVSFVQGHLYMYWLDRPWSGTLVWQAHLTFDPIDTVCVCVFGCPKGPRGSNSVCVEQHHQWSCPTWIGEHKMIGHSFKALSQFIGTG